MCLDTHISTFMKFYRETFPSTTVFPKLHIMEDHVVPWVRRWRLGEQGAESIHAQNKRLERTYQGIPDDLERLKYVIREQIIESNPSFLS